MFLLRRWHSVSCSLFTNVIDFALHIFNANATEAAAEVILKWLNGLLLFDFDFGKLKKRKYLNQIKTMQEGFDDIGSLVITYLLHN